MEREALKLATEGLERILGSFEKDGKVVMKSMIRNELFAEMHLLLKKAKKVLAKPAQRTWIGLSDADIADVVDTTCQYTGSYEEFLIKKAERKIKELNT